MKNFLLSSEIKINSYKKNFLSVNIEWYNYLRTLNINPILYYNERKKINIDKNYKKIDGVILSGGGDLYKISKKKKDADRDEFELNLIDYAIKKKLPIIGVCRGFQLFANKIGCELSKIDNHYGNSHTLIQSSKKLMKVNSFHKYKIVDHNSILNVIASFKDSIEIATYKKYNFLGLMFHPERKNYDQIKVNLLIKKFLLKQL